jgi:hypothetical protein
MNMGHLQLHQETGAAGGLRAGMLISKQYWHYVRWVGAKFRSRSGVLVLVV